MRYVIARPAYPVFRLSADVLIEVRSVIANSISPNGERRAVILAQRPLVLATGVKISSAIDVRRAEAGSVLTA